MAGRVLHPSSPELPEGSVFNPNPSILPISWVCEFQLPSADDEVTKWTRIQDRTKGASLV